MWKTAVWATLLKRLKKFLKKSHFVKHLVYKYLKRQPLWRPLLRQRRQFWSSALKQAKGCSRILIATSIGSNIPGTTLESMLAIALTLRGAEIHVFLCDGVLPACMACSSDIYPDHKKFAQYGPSQDCYACFRPAFQMYQSLGVTVHRYSDFLSLQEIQNAKEVALTIPVQEISRYTLDGVAVGEHAEAGTLRFFARGMLENEKYAEAILRRYFHASLLTTVATKRLLEKYHFLASVFHHGIYVPQGLIGEVCRKQGVPVKNWNAAYRKKCFIFSHDDTYHHTMMGEPIEKWIHIPWNDKLESQLMNYLKSRWEGSQDWIWFHERPQFDLQKLASQTGIDFSKPCIGLLTSVMWDAVLHYPSNAFPNMLEWVKVTIAYFKNRPDLQLIIRVHPAEIRGTLPSRQYMAEEIKKFYPELPKNIIVIPPESNVSTYAVMMQCNAVIIYNTKMGAELTAMGIPVIVAGEAWVRNKGFTMDIDSLPTYGQVLDRLPLPQRMNEEDTLQAKKYAYHFFFRRMIPLEFMESVEGPAIFRIHLETIKKLSPDCHRGLDIICDGILKDIDFIYPLESWNG
jgi:hypothetical protein